MPANYFWNGEEVIVVEAILSSLTVDHLFLYMLVVDTHRIIPEYRYGYFYIQVGVVGWKHTPLEKFPKEFRTHLLLLGVT